MSRVILLTAEQAASVVGPSRDAPDLAALQPVALSDGRYILGVEVLDDPLHAEDRAFLAGLPQAEAEDIAALLIQPVGPHR